MDLIERIDCAGLIAHINDALHREEVPLCLDRVRPSVVERVAASVRAITQEREVFTLTKYDVLQPHKLALLHPFNARGKVGSLLLAEGACTDDGEPYTHLTMRLTTPLRLQTSSAYLPPCTVSFDAIFYEGVGPEITRKDVVRMRHARTDLSHILPGRYFFSQLQ